MKELGSLNPGCPATILCQYSSKTSDDDWQTEKIPILFTKQLFSRLVFSKTDGSTRVKQS